MSSRYPAHLVRQITLRDGSTITLRPIRPDDAGIEADFVRALSDESRYYRFMDTLRELSPAMISHFTQVDYVNHMALIATFSGDGPETEIGVARYIVNPDGRSAEFAVVVADSWQGRGVASHLMALLIESARARGLAALVGEVLASNHKMLAFVLRQGFGVATDPSDPHLVHVEKKLA